MRKALTRALVLLASLACCSFALALDPSLDISQYAHTSWTVRDGFFKGTISSIAQTPDGYLWLGTEFGLLRFDGVRSVLWQPPAGERLPGNIIGSLLAGRDGTLWIGTYEGLASWKRGKLTHYPELAGQSVIALLEDREGTIWAGGYALPAARLCAIQNGNVQCHGEDGSLGQWVESLYEDREGQLWSGGMTGLWRWKAGPQKHYPMPDPVSSSQGLIEGDKGALLIAMKSAIGQLVDGKVRPYTLPGVRRQFTPLHLLRDRDGSLWIGTLNRGLVHVHQGRTDVFERSDGLSGDFIYSLFEDREGDIWVATNNGLDRFRGLAVLTVSLNQGHVWSVLAARDGSVWFGTSDGLNRWNEGQITTYRKGSSGLPDNYVESLFQDVQRRIWVSTRRSVAWFEDGRFHLVHGVPDGVHSITEDGAGNLWISTDGGLYRLRAGSVVERIPWASIGRGEVAFTLFSDPVQGGLWLGFHRSGVAYFKDGKVRTSYSRADGLGAGRINGLQRDRNGTLWAATDGGLSRFYNGKVQTFTSRNGLPCDSVHWVLEDDTHAFWLGMACGLVRVARPELDAWGTDPGRTVQTTVFDTSDGVRSHATASNYSPRVASSADGRIWFLPGDGVSAIDPRHIPVNKLAPPVHIEQITADGKKHEPSPHLRLPALTRDLEIEYTALSLVDPNKVHFRLKLEGQDGDWQEVINERKVQYTNLKPSHYRFRVMACNNSGVWNEAGASFDFSVDPAWYQTTWFRLSCVAASLALLWALYRYRLHQIAREFNVRLEERVEERTRIARDLHDTLLQSFQGLMLHLQIGVGRLPRGEAKDALEKTLEIGDQAIVEGRDAIHDLRSSTVEENDLAKAVRALGDELATQDSAEFRLVVEGSSRNLHPILREEIYRIAREAVRNAFAHAQASKIEVEITYGERLLRLRIRDDGRGIDPAIMEQGRTGHYGLPGMRERATRIGAQLNVCSAIGAGTELELSLPGAIAYGSTPGRRWWHRLQRVRSANPD